MNSSTITTSTTYPRASYTTTTRCFSPARVIRTSTYKSPTRVYTTTATQPNGYVRTTNFDDGSRLITEKTPNKLGEDQITSTYVAVDGNRVTTVSQRSPLRYSATKTVTTPFVPVTTTISYKSPVREYRRATRLNSPLKVVRQSSPLRVSNVVTTTVRSPLRYSSPSRVVKTSVVRHSSPFRVSTVTSRASPVRYSSPLRVSTVTSRVSPVRYSSPLRVSTVTTTTTPAEIRYSSPPRVMKTSEVTYTSPFRTSTTKKVTFGNNKAERLLSPGRLRKTTKQDFGFKRVYTTVSENVDPRSPERATIITSTVYNGDRPSTVTYETVKRNQEKVEEIVEEKSKVLADGTIVTEKSIMSPTRYRKETTSKLGSSYKKEVVESDDGLLGEVTTITRQI